MPQQVPETVALNDQMREAIARRLQAGRHQTVEEVITAGLSALESAEREAEAEIAEIRRQVQEGLEQYRRGDMIPSERVAEELRALREGRHRRAG